MRLLRREGVKVGANRVRRLMVQNGLYGRRRHRRRTYDDATGDAASPNLLRRNFEAKRPDLIWCGDITQFRVRLRWLYVATVIDLYSRRVVGLAFGIDATSDLTVRAMLDACKRRKPAEGLVFHTDRGVQYRSLRFRRVMNSRAIVQSMSRPGNCLDNAVAESFFATLEHELASRRVWSSLEEAELEIRNFTMTFYNQERLHSSANFLPPAEFEELNAP
jgi:putative transposase